ncbi:unnamed protein product [Onchocerca flexuosa]|uniref:C2H2-type domain-containing protein n=1 Tax=Onchocerca flexuosa TaxID=387005 RepID=A0A3P7XFL0_9BILA|nr:unnamed protein product [Onchocerca flexuosa]
MKSILSPDHVEFTARLEQQEPVSDNFICLDSFDLESILGPDSDEQKYKCGYPGCKWTIPDIKDYIEHIRIHNSRGVNMCHWYGCKKSFRTLVKLRKHQRLHQFKFECENCWRLFNNKHACKAHKKCCSKNFP